MNDRLRLYWRRVAYGEVLKRMAELHLYFVLSALKEELLLEKLTTPVEKAFTFTP